MRTLNISSFFALGLIGCTLSPIPASTNLSATAPDSIDDGNDAHTTETDFESLSLKLVGGSSRRGTLGAASIASDTPAIPSNMPTADEIKALFYPSSCLTVTADDAKKTATYDFNDCTGTHGLVHVIGKVTVTYSFPALNKVSLSINSTGLKINGATIDWTASSIATFKGSEREMTWDGHFTGTTKRGRSIERTNHKEYNWNVDQPCLRVSGTSNGKVTSRELKTEVISFNICKGGCPEAGSELKITDVTTNKVYDIKWGETDAVYTAPNGTATHYVPLCAR